MAKTEIKLHPKLAELLSQLKGVLELFDVAKGMSDNGMMLYAEQRRIEIEDQLIILN